MTFLHKLYGRFINDLATLIANALYEKEQNDKWLATHGAQLHRARAIALIEDPKNANNFEYLKEQVSKQG